MKKKHSHTQRMAPKYKLTARNGVEYVVTQNGQLWRKENLVDKIEDLADRTPTQARMPSKKRRAAWRRRHGLRVKKRKNKAGGTPQKVSS